MSLYFPLLDPFHPVWEEVEEALGEKACWEVARCLGELYEYPSRSFDAENVRKWARVKKDRAVRLLPFVQKVLKESLKIWRKSSRFTEDLREICGTFVEDFEGQNPHGSTRDQNESKLKKEKTPLPPKPEIKFPNSPAGELVKYLYDKLRARGVTETVLNADWIRIGVDEANKLLRTQPCEVVREAIDWFSTDQRFWAKNLSRMSNISKNWVQFETARPRNVVTQHDTEWAKLLKFKRLRIKGSSDIIPTAELQPVGGRPWERAYKGESLGWQILEGVEA